MSLELKCNNFKILDHVEFHPICWVALKTVPIIPKTLPCLHHLLVHLQQKIRPEFVDTGPFTAQPTARNTHNSLKCTEFYRIRDCVMSKYVCVTVLVPHLSI